MLTCGAKNEILLASASSNIDSPQSVCRGLSGRDYALTVLLLALTSKHLRAFSFALGSGWWATAKIISTAPRKGKEHKNPTNRPWTGANSHTCIFEQGLLPTPERQCRATGPRYGRLIQQVGFPRKDIGNKSRAGFGLNLNPSIKTVLGGMICRGLRSYVSLKFTAAVYNF
jgi:hypothetical protein